MFKNMKAEISRLYKPKFPSALVESGKIFIVSVISGMLIWGFDLGISKLVELVLM